MGPDIFICYRRKDSRYIAGHLYRRLTQEYGADHVFKDVDTLPLGRDYRHELSDRVGGCTVFLAVIGSRWLTATDAEGRRTLDDPGDFVRLEIESALRKNIPVIPVLVDDVSIPTVEELPASLAELVYRQGVSVRPDPDFDRDVDRLIKGINHATQTSAASAAPATTAEPPPATAAVVPPAQVSTAAKTTPPQPTSRYGYRAGWAVAAVAIGVGILAYWLRDPVPSAEKPASPPVASSTQVSSSQASPAQVQPQAGAGELGAIASPAPETMAEQYRRRFGTGTLGSGASTRELLARLPTSAGTKPPYGPMANWDDAWYMQFSVGSLAEACQRVTEPDLANGLVVQCEMHGSPEKIHVRLGPAKDRTQIDIVRKRYLDKGVFTFIYRKEVCIKPVHIDCSAVAR